MHFLIAVCVHAPKSWAFLSPHECRLYKCNGGNDSIMVVYLVTVPNVLQKEVLSWPGLLRIGGVEEDSTHTEFLTPCVIPTIESVCACALQTCVYT